MYAGLDFGTSNCSIGIWSKEEPRLINLTGKSPLMASALYASKIHTETPEIDDNELVRRISSAKRDQVQRKKEFTNNQAQRKADFIKEQAQKKEKSVKDNSIYHEEGFDETVFNELTDAMLESRTRATMRRESIEKAIKEYEQYSLNEILTGTDDIVFGEEAIKNHVLYPKGGRFIKSPKSFLGASVTSSHLSAFTVIVAKMLENIKRISEKKINNNVDSIVLGKPVNFHGAAEKNGNEQALRILESAAKTAGYKDIEFMFEPIAAALDYERSITKDQIVLVLDAGGGTTDCSLVQVGPSYNDKTHRDDNVLGYAGDRVGGTDIDIAMAMGNIMPLFGKDSFMQGETANKSLPIPNRIYSDAVSINDVQAQRRFSSGSMHRQIEDILTFANEPEKINRLLYLRKHGLSYRLNRSSELAKIHLSDHELVNLPLHYVESNLHAIISREDLKESMERILDKFTKLMNELQQQTQITPDVIYITGGTAKSPVINEWIRSHYGDIEIVSGDSFGSVTAGLTTWAHKIFE